MQLNRGEERHKLACAILHGKPGELRQRYREGQEDQLGALGLVIKCHCVVGTSMPHSSNPKPKGFGFYREDVARLSPLVFDHINLLGRYAFSIPDSVARGELRQLRNPADAMEDVAWSRCLLCLRFGEAEESSTSR